MIDLDEWERDASEHGDYHQQRLLKLIQAHRVMKKTLESIEQRTGGFDTPPTNYWKDELIDYAHKQAILARVTVDKLMRGGV